MALEFASDEWAKALMAALKTSPGYQDAAKKWEGDLTFIIEAEGGLSEPRYIYLDLWHGDCRDAFAMSSLDEKDSEFKLNAPYGIWKDVIQGRLDPIKGITRGKLKVKGPMLKIVKSPKAALELVKSAGQLDTEFP